MTSTRTTRKPTVYVVAALLSLFLVCLCANLKSAPRPSTVQPQQAGYDLEESNLIGLLDCATRPDQLLAVQADSYGADSFRLRYVYPALPGREANELNMLSPKSWVALALYNRDDRSAALLEVGFEVTQSERKFTLLDGANLEQVDGHWVLKNILSGGGSTWPELAGHVAQIAMEPLVTIPRADVKRTSAVCQFPAAGRTFSAISADERHVGWKFKDGVSDGVQFKEQSGPFTNTDPKRGPANTVYLNTYGPS